MGFSRGSVGKIGALCFVGDSVEYPFSFSIQCALDLF